MSGRIPHWYWPEETPEESYWDGWCRTCGGTGSGCRCEKEEPHDPV